MKAAVANKCYRTAHTTDKKELLETPFSKCSYKPLRHQYDSASEKAAESGFYTFALASKCVSELCEGNILYE